MRGRTLVMTSATLIAMAGSAMAQVEKVAVHSSGMTCPFCAYNMEKRLKKLDGVESNATIETFLDKGLTVAPWRTSQPFDPSSVSSTVKKSGFTLREIDVTAVGVLRARPGIDSTELDLTVPGAEQIFKLSPASAEQASQEQSWKALLAFTEEAKTDRTVRVQGRVEQTGSDGAASGVRLTLLSWEPIKFGAEVYMSVEGFSCVRCAARTMRKVDELDDVIHIEADHSTGLVHVWTKSDDPDVAALRAAITDLGFKVAHADAPVKGAAAHNMAEMDKAPGS